MNINNIKIRWAREEDLPRIYEIEKRSYPPYLQAKREIIKKRFHIFGIIVAENDDENKILGFSTMVPAWLPWYDKQKVFDIVMKRRNPYYLPWLEDYVYRKERGMDFNTLWVMSTAVETAYQNQGVGSLLIEKTLDITRNFNLIYRASALKCEYAKNKTRYERIEDYIKRVEKGEVRDRFLSLYIKKGFCLVTPLPDYEPDHPTRRRIKGVNFNILAYKLI